jgi:hypothetical protein
MRNQCLIIGTYYLQPNRMHIHWNEFVQHRDDQRSSVHDNLLAAEARSYK